MMTKTRLYPKEAFDRIGVRYDYGMLLVRKGELDGCFYRIGRRVIFVEEMLDAWIDKRLKQAN